jgi:hypothetical protein
MFESCWARQIPESPRSLSTEAFSLLGAGRLRKDDSLVLFITRRNWLTRPLIGRWWQANLYDADELREAFSHAGFSQCFFRGFPSAAHHLALWGYAIEARG